MVQNKFVSEAKQFFKDEKYQFSYQFKDDLNILEQVDDPNKLSLPDIAKY